MHPLLMLAVGRIHWTSELANWLHGRMTDPWVLFGFAAQAVFASRFVVQWIASERRGRSVIPVMFWYLSVLGTLMLAFYAVHIKDLVFIAASALNTLIYVRNLMLIHHPKPLPAQSADGAER